MIDRYRRVGCVCRQVVDKALSQDKDRHKVGNSPRSVNKKHRISMLIFLHHQSQKPNLQNPCVLRLYVPNRAPISSDLRAKGPDLDHQFDLPLKSNCRTHPHTFHFSAVIYMSLHHFGNHRFCSGSDDSHVSTSFVFVI